jgi:DNA-binding NarL/FixJ family response regulator
MTTRDNTTLDDIATVIGFTATLRLAAYYGGQNLYVPANPDEGCQIVRLIGLSASRRLAGEFGSEHVAVPTMWAYEEDQRNRLILNLLKQGQSPKEIAHTTGMTERRVQQIRRHLEDVGLMPLIVKEKASEKSG